VDNTDFGISDLFSQFSDTTTQVRNQSRPNIYRNMSNITRLAVPRSIREWPLDKSEATFNRFLNEMEIGGDAGDAVKGAMWSHFILNGVSESTDYAGIDLVVGGQIVNLSKLGDMVGKDLRKFLKAWQQQAYDALKSDGSVSLREAIFRNNRRIGSAENAAAAVDWFDEAVLNEAEAAIWNSIKSHRVALAEKKKSPMRVGVAEIGDIAPIVHGSPVRSNPNNSTGRQY